MTKNKKLIVLLLGTSVLFFVMALTHEFRLLGTLLGYWLVFFYIQWLQKVARSCLKLDVSVAIQRMRRSFFARLGFVTCVVAIVGRFQENWLFSMALGLALGLMVFLISDVMDYFHKERGEL